ncbi:MAG: ABC transporter permease [Acidobacteriaceae bacterium]|nr:ABC transporter permease [Acidobacteriaceae bacterium]
MGWSRFLRRKHWDEARAHELEVYLEIETEENITRGMSAEEARQAARRKLGNPTLIREEIYRMNTVTFIESFWQDLRFALRTLAKTPGFASVVVFSLALGIGANTAIFSLINAALLKMLPVQNPEQLVQFKTADYWFPYSAYKEFRDHNRVFSGVLAFQTIHNVDFEVNGQAAIANGQVISGNYFSVLGVPAILGRTITPEDDQVAGESPVAVISYDYWQRRFALNPTVIGKKVVLNNSPFTIVGVTAPEFFGLEPGERIDVSVPLTMIEQIWPGYAAKDTPYYVLTSPVRNWLRIMARLKPGVTTERALPNLQPIFREAVREALAGLSGLPFDSPAGRRMMLQSKLQLTSGGQGLAALRQRFSKPLFILMAAVALLLLITCANVANLVLARANVRSKEIAVRLTVGAGQLRLMRQLITESALLSIIGGALGLLLAFWASRSLLTLVSHSSAPIWLRVRPDSSVLSFTMLVSLLTALLFGIIPAWRAARTGLTAALVESTRISGKSSSRSSMAKSLIVLQIALSLVLLVGAGLLARSLGNLKDFYPGFNKDNVLLFSVNPGLVGYKDTNALYRTLLEQFKTLPGVRAASFSMDPPLSGHFSGTEVKVEGYKPQSGKELTLTGLNLVGPAYFATLESPILMGRDFTTADQAHAPKVAIVNEALARTYFRDTNPLGRRISMPGWVGDPSWFEIVGVAKDLKQRDLREEPKPMAYMPASQSGVPSGVTFEVRTAMNPTAISTAILHTVAQIDSRVPIVNVRTLSEQLDDSLLAERLVASLSTVFGALALLLACIGLYGLMTYAINRRTPEIGIRIAVGATRAQIAGMVLQETVQIILIGFGIGIPAAIAAGRLIKSELYGLKSDDPVTILLAIFIMATVALLAAYFPARRASRVDPMVALRTE